MHFDGPPLINYNFISVLTFELTWVLVFLTESSKAVPPFILFSFLPESRYSNQHYIICQSVKAQPPVD